MPLENKLNELEQNRTCIFDRNYSEYKNKINQIYQGKANGVKKKEVSVIGTSLDKILRNFPLTEKNNTPR